MINMLILHKIAINLNFILSVFERRVFSLIHPFCQQSCCLRALLQHYKCYQIVLISFNILDINFQSGTKFIYSILIDNSLFYNTCFRVYKFFLLCDWDLNFDRIMYSHNCYMKYFVILCLLVTTKNVVLVQSRHTTSLLMYNRVFTSNLIVFPAQFLFSADGVNKSCSLHKLQLISHWITHSWKDKVSQHKLKRLLWNIM